jgi:predicted DNA-binding protein
MTNAMPDNDWVQFNMRLRPEMAEKLDDEASRVGISRAALMRVIIDQYYQATEKDES